jgi:Secretion system C-terminal sorting domain
MKTFAFTILFIALTVQFSDSQWLQASNGIGNRSISSLAANSNNIYAGTKFGGVYSSNNNGATWNQTSLSGYTIGALALNGNYVFAGLDFGLGVFLSTNNGVNWVQTLSNRNVFALAASGSYVFAGTFGSNGGVFRSSDNGTSWTLVLGNLNINSLLIKGGYILAGTYWNGVYLSSNNGTTWIQTTLSNADVRSMTDNGNIIYAGTYDYGVYSSADYGITWIQTSLNTQKVLSMAADGTRVFAGTEGSGVFVSNDNGATWAQYNQGLGNDTVRSFCTHNNYLFAGTNSRGVWQRQLNQFTGINSISNVNPSEFSLSQNYPNPFNPSTNISFSLPASSKVNLSVFNTAGQQVAELVNENLSAGTYEYQFNAGKLTSGVYFYRLTTDQFTYTKKMILVK